MAKHDGRRGGLRARLRYEFDKSVAAGPLAPIGWLALLSLVLILAAGAAMVVPGIDDAGWGFRAVMAVVALGGVFVVSALVAVLSAALRGRLDELRRGRSIVLEREHTIILNWSPAIFDIVAGLAVANASRRRPRIVIMADRDKSEMEEEMARRVPDLRNIRVICRSGDPTDPGDLAIASPDTARAIIIVSPEAADPDRRVVKTVLALIRDPHRRATKYRIVAEIRDRKNADLAGMAGGDEVQLVLADELMARIVVHTSRQAGLPAVHAALLDPGRSRICLAEQKAIEGTSFGDAMMAYPTSTLIGLTDHTGKVYLNPPMETVIQPGMKAILVAESEAAIQIAANPPNVDHAAISLYRRQDGQAERTLMLGWNRRAPMIAFELSRHVAPGSLLTIAADTPELQEDVGGLMISGANLQVEYGIVDTASRAALEGLDIASYDHVLVLGYCDHMDGPATNTRTLVTLLHLRRIAETAGGHVNIVSEMIDTRNRDLAGIAGADDFVVSDRLVGLMLAATSENQNVASIFADLLDEQGPDLLLREAEAYLEPDHPLSFYTVTEACRRRGEVALGFVRPRAAGGPGTGVVVNPRKSDVLSYEAGDKIIVLARD